MNMFDQLPAEIREEIQKQEDKQLLDGMIRFVEPERLAPVLKEGYAQADRAIPFAITAFGDILTWEGGKYIYKVSLRHGTADVLACGVNYFFDDLGDSEYAEEHFEIALFRSAKQKLGALSDSECYGFVPLETLGGFADIDHMRKVKYVEYLYLILQSV